MKPTILLLLAISTLGAHDLRVERLSHADAQELSYLEQQAAEAKARYDAALARAKAKYSTPEASITIEDGYVLIRTFTEEEIDEINQHIWRYQKNNPEAYNAIWDLLNRPYPGTPPFPTEGTHD